MTQKSKTWPMGASGAPDQEAKIGELMSPSEALAGLLRSLDELITNSKGVTGLFNDQINEPWHELLSGRLDAWLGTSINRARRALSRAEEAKPMSLVTLASPRYRSLAEVLQMALDQAQSGKGAERHADDKAFSSQPILEIARMLRGVDGHAFQMIKKAQEAARMASRGKHDAAVAEFLGVIVYASAAVIRIREDAERQTPAMATISDAARAV